MKRVIALAAAAAALSVGPLAVAPLAAEQQPATASTTGSTGTSALRASPGLREALPPAVADELFEKGMVQKTTYGKTGLALACAPALSIVSTSKELIPFSDATYLSETLYLYPKKNATAPGADIDRVSSILRSISRLQGLEYYSNSRKKMWPLYESSYAVDNPATRKRIDDPTSGNGDGKTVFAVQKDTTFGEYLYRYDYRQTPDSVAFFSRNLEPMRYGIIKIVDTERFHASLVVRDFGDCLLVYGVTYANIAYVPAVGNRLNASFTARAEAMYKWFIKEYER